MRFAFAKHNLRSDDRVVLITAWLAALGDRVRDPVLHDPVLHVYFLLLNEKIRHFACAVAGPCGLRAAGSGAEAIYG